MKILRTQLGHGYGGSKKEGRPPAPGATPTLGRLVSRDGKFSCDALERAIDDPEHPCIPAGVFAVVLGEHHPGTPGAYPCPVITGVPGRTAIEMHIANDTTELEGCVATGERVSDDGHSIELSRAAFDRLMKYLDGAFPFSLEVINPPDPAEMPA